MSVFHATREPKLKGAKSMEPKYNYSVCFRKTILQPSDYLLSAGVTNGKDGYELQLEKVGQLFQVLTLN